MDITPAEFGPLKDQIELMEVTTPAPGQALTTVQMRRSYGRLVEDIRVDSAALAALISQARAEAMSTDTVATLQTPAGIQHRWTGWRWGFKSRGAGNDYSFDLYPPHSRDSEGTRLWWGRENLNDSLGRRWSRFVSCVTDDFGNLVEVPA